MRSGTLRHFCHLLSSCACRVVLDYLHTGLSSALGPHLPSVTKHDLHRCCTDVRSCFLGSAPTAGLCSPGRAVPAWGAWGMSALLYCFVFALGTKMLGGMGRIMCGIVVVLFISLFFKFALLPVRPLSLKYGRCRGEGLKKKPEI